MSKGFICAYCGHGTLVRSNMKGTMQGKWVCVAVDACEARQAAALSFRNVQASTDTIAALGYVEPTP